MVYVPHQIFCAANFKGSRKLTVTHNVHNPGQHGHEVCAATFLGQRKHLECVTTFSFEEEETLAEKSPPLVLKAKLTGKTPSIWEYINRVVRRMGWA